MKSYYKLPKFSLYTLEKLTKYSNKILIYILYNISFQRRNLCLQIFPLEDYSAFPVYPSPQSSASKNHKSSFCLQFSVEAQHIPINLGPRVLGKLPPRKTSPPDYSPLGKFPPGKFLTRKTPLSENSLLRKIPPSSSDIYYCCFDNLGIFNCQFVNHRFHSL